MWCQVLLSQCLEVLLDLNSDAKFCRQIGSGELLLTCHTPSPVLGHHVAAPMTAWLSRLVFRPSVGVLTGCQPCSFSLPSQ